MAFSAGHTTTLISKDAEIIGDIKFSGDLEIQGQVTGNIIAKGDAAAMIRIVEGGKIEGSIHAPKVIINGTLVGDVHASEHIELAAKANVQGSVHYSLIEMVKGSQVNGNLLYAEKSHLATKKASAKESKSVVD